MLPGGPSPDGPPPVHADGGAGPSDAPRASWLRRRGLAIVAAFLVIVVGVGLWWFVLVTKANDANDAHLGSECSGSPADTYRLYTNFSMIPDDPALVEASAAFRRLSRSPRWRVDVTADEHGENPVRLTMVRDGETVEFRREGGTRGRLVPDGALVAVGGDSSFWVATCHDPSAVLFAPGNAGCVEKRSSGSETVFTYRGAGSKAADCAATTNTIDYEVVLRDGKLVRWSFDVTTASGVSHDEWRVVAPVALDEPGPWQVVPEWFVDLVG